tara:strand:+ start:292 stop:519 length:228 start_codon:yes stop_codon:yes gene_type:complete
MTHFKIAQSIRALIMIAGNDINNKPTAETIDWVLDNAIKTIILLVPEGDRAQVMEVLSDDDCSRSLYAISRTSGH